jgi:acyl-CoA reductase-like NAD-dependent aldehyde dehydrogenase
MHVTREAARAVALARAAAPRVIVRPSSREPVFARVLVEALGDAAITLVSTLDLAAITEGEVHVYGRDATIAEVRAAVRPSIRVRGHGAGMGIACIGRNDALEAAATALVRDVVPFDQRGCLSPRVAFVLGDVRRARRFARHVHDALIAAERTTPRGALDPQEREELTWYTETVSFGGELHEGKAHAVGVGEQLLLPPPGRHVHVMNVDDAIALKETLAPVASAIAAVGYDDRSLALALPPHARQSALGRMQHPPFDGPVDRRSETK